MKKTTALAVTTALLTASTKLLAIVSGSDVTGSVGPGDLTDSYTIHAPAGAVIRAGVGEIGDTGFDPAVEIISPSGASLDYAWDDTGAGAYVSSAPVSGTYTIKVEDYYNNEAGSYRLSVVVGPAPQSASHDNFLNATSGSDFTGRIERGEFDVLTIDAPAGAVVRAAVGEIGETGFDPAVEIISPSGASLDYAWDDTGAGAYVSTAPVSGTYTIVVEDYSRDEAGDYRLSVVVGPAPQSTSHDNFLNATSGSDFTGRIERGEFDVLTIHAPAGAVVRAAVGEIGETGFDPAVEIISPSGASLDYAWDDTGAGAYVSTAPVSGTYTIVVEDYSRDEAGDYRLSVVVGPAPQSTSHDNFLNATSGSDFTGRIERGEFDVLTIHAPAGAVVRAAVGEIGETGFDPAVEIISPSGASLDYAWDDTGAGAYVSTAPVSGIYSIVVEDYSRDEAGDYRLSVVVGPAPQSTSHDNFLNATSGSDFTGRIERGEFDVLTIDVTAGAVIRAGVGEIGETGFDPAVEIISPSGASLDYAWDDTGTVAYVSSAPISGTYTIVIEDYSRDEAGDYLVSVVAGGASELAAADNTTVSNGQAISASLDRGDADVHAFGGRAGDTLQLTIADTRLSNFSPRVELLSPTGASLGFRNYGTHQFTLPSTGNYFLVVADYGQDAPGTYQISASGFTGSLALDFVSVIEAPPTLSIDRLPSGAIEIWWPSTHTGWSLETATGLNPNSFIPQPAELAGDRFRHVISNPSGKRFFRLTR